MPEKLAGKRRGSLPRRSSLALMPPPPPPPPPVARGKAPKVKSSGNRMTKDREGKVSTMGAEAGWEWNVG